MSTGSWLRTHKKQVTIHTLILSAFLLFLFFLAEPLFDRVERIPGEASLHQLQLPAATDDIRYGFDVISVQDRGVVETGGWAFIEGQDTDGSSIFIVLQSADRTYVLDTQAVRRPDVTKHFKELNLNLDLSGFTVLIPASEIASGEYIIGIYISKGDIEALQYTARIVEF